MNESEFLELADAVFERIQNTIDQQGVDVECTINGAVLELEFDDGSKVIVNRHAPNQELWIAAKSGGFHFGLRDKQWRNTRDSREFFEHLGELIAVHSGEAFRF
ncbi:MAG: iron donor protein CyaY [Chitinivorax sp.]